MNRGFTVAEVLVTLVVMTILLTLGTVGIRSSLMNARDAERADDIAAIARGMEQYYKRGNPYFKGAVSSQGTYPGANTMISISGEGWCTGTTNPDASKAAEYTVCRDYYADALPGVNVEALTPPDKTSIQLVVPWLKTGSDSATTLITTWMQTEINAGNYVYKPMADNSYALCYETGSCTRFALFYKKETTGETVTVWSTYR